MTAAAPAPPPARASRRGRGPAGADLTLIPGLTTISSTVLPFAQSSSAPPASSAASAELPPRASVPPVSVSVPASGEAASLQPLTDRGVTVVAPPTGSVDATLPPGALKPSEAPAFVRRERSVTISSVVVPSPALPFQGAPGAGAPPSEAPASQDVSALPFTSAAQAYSAAVQAYPAAAPATQRTPEIQPFTPSDVPVPLPVSPPAPALEALYLPVSPPVVAPPAALGLLGALATLTGTQERPDPPAPASEPPSTERPPAQPEAAPELVLDDYPPERCGAIAARVASDPAAAADVLRAESLDEERWKRVHEHWLGHIQEAVARSRKKPQADYDAAFVAAVEARRGPITIKEYSTLAEAAERGAVAGALADLSMPEGAWPHVHRAWIGRLVKDVALGRQVRAAIDAVRAGG